MTVIITLTAFLINYEVLIHFWKNNVRITVLRKIKIHRKENSEWENSHHLTKTIQFLRVTSIQTNNITTFKNVNKFKIVYIFKLRL